MEVNVLALKVRLAPRLALLFLAAGLVPLGVTLLVLVPHGEDALRTSAKLLHQSELEGLRARVDGALDELMGDVRIVSTAHADRSGRGRAARAAALPPRQAPGSHHRDASSSTARSCRGCRPTIARS